MLSRLDDKEPCKSMSFGFFTTLYRATKISDAKLYCLRRIHGLWRLLEDVEWFSEPPPTLIMHRNSILTNCVIFATFYVHCMYSNICI